MSLELVRQVGQEHPELLPTNLGRTCYAHTSFLIEKLLAAGHSAQFICKSPGEGQYTPPGFQRRTVRGLDGKPYLCSGVSHDAIWCDGQQFDTLASANEYDQPIYRKIGEPYWSFDPNDGPQIRATAVWNAIPQVNWRAWNPPLVEDVNPGPPLSPPMFTSPPRDYVGKFFYELDLFYKTHGRANRTGNPDDPLHVDNEGLFVWLSEYLRHYAIDHPKATIADRHVQAVLVTLADIEKVWR